MLHEEQPGELLVLTAYVPVTINTSLSHFIILFQMMMWIPVFCLITSSTNFKLSIFNKHGVYTYLHAVILHVKLTLYVSYGVICIICNKRIIRMKGD